MAEGLYPSKELVRERENTGKREVEERGYRNQSVK
jgi:hypothetical protein